MIQGNLDPLFLTQDKEPLLSELKRVTEDFKKYPYVFNLGHGIQPQTKIEMVEKLVKTVRSFN